jgi:mannose-6-phosphate isomerase-like protein (cupin superfamily)
MALGLTVAAIPVFASTPSAAAKMTYGPNEGKELAPGVRMVELGTFNSDIPAYKSISMVDIIFQPGAVAPESVMENDMMCYIVVGEFTIKKADKEFSIKEGEMYTCAKGKTDMATNTSNVVGIHRIGMLMPA